MGGPSWCRVPPAALRGLAALCVLGGATLPVAGQEPPRLRHRVHDLVARLDTAEPSDRSIHLTARHPVVVPFDPRPGVAFVQTRPERFVVFGDLPTVGVTTLSFALGVVDPAHADEDLPVRFLVDTSTDRDPTWRRVFDQTYRPSDLPTDTRLVDHELTLPGTGPVVRTLKFWALPAGEASLAARWPGWSCPQVRSAGRPLALADDPLLLPDAGQDLLAELDLATFGGGVDGRRRPMDPAPGVELAGGARSSLRLAAPARARWEVTVPPAAELVALVGVDAPTSWHLGGGELELAIQVGDRTVSTHTFDAAGRQQDRGWKELRVDLSPWSGRDVTLGLALGEGERRGPDVLAVARLSLRDGSGQPRLARDAAPTVVVLMADTLRADALGPHTPNLSALAAAGVRYDAARSASSWTWPATASLFTGLDPQRHGLLDNDHPVLAGGARSLAQILGERGYTTGAFVANALVSSQAGLARGFETFVLAPQARAGALNDRVAAWLEETPDTARFLYVHYMDPHGPYQAVGALDDEDAFALSPRAADEAMNAGIDQGLQHPDTRSRVDALREAYAAEVADLDQAIGELFVSLRGAGALEDAWVVFVSDHGEEFLEHGRTSHGWQLFDETLAVPLSLTGFGPSAREPAVVSAPVSTRDLMPTLLSLLGLPTPSGRGLGWPLAPVDGGATPPVFGHTQIGLLWDQERRTELATVIHDGHKLIVAPEFDRAELYDLTSDPGEQVDLAEQQPERVATLRRALQAWLSLPAVDTSGDLDDADLEEALRVLRALGYLGDDDDG